MVAAPRGLLFLRVSALVVAGSVAALAMTPIAAQDSADDLDVPRFVEIADAAGLRHTFESDAEFSIGGGAAAFDCDNDHDADLFIAGGNAPAGLFRNLSEPDTPLRFKNISAMLGLDDTGIRRISGAYPIDFDNDNDLDLFVLRFGANQLLENDGKCNFSIAGGKAGIPDTDDRTTAFAATWRMGNDSPVLFIGNHAAPAPEPGKTGACAPSYVVQTTDGQPDQAEIQPIAPSFCPLSYLLIDWSGRGQFDLRTANDLTAIEGGAGSGQLFRVEDDTVSAFGEGDGWQAIDLSGFALAARDVDGDGLPEIVEADRRGGRLYAIEGEPAQPDFEDRSQLLGFADEAVDNDGQIPVFSWHVEFADFNNDSVSDLLIVRGQRQSPPVPSSHDQDMLLLGKPDGGFHNVGQEAGFALDTVGRGAAIADFDRDGCQDIVVVNRDAPVSLFRNRHCDGNNSPGWLEVELEQDGVNGCAVGASIILRAGDNVQTQARTIGGGHAGGSKVPLHFGLGDNMEAVLRVRWPDGSITDPITIPANRVATIKRSGQTITVNMGE